MKLKGLDYLDISSNFSDDEIMIQHSVREFVDNEVMSLIDEHFKNGTFPGEQYSYPISTESLAKLKESEYFVFW